MSIFGVEDAFGGNAIGFGPSHPAVDLMLDVAPLRQQHSGALVLKGGFATDQEIDSAIEDLKRDLETLRAAAKDKLRAYVERARLTARSGP